MSKSDVLKHKSKPQMFLIAGINGTGKSTFFHRHIASKITGVEFVNADEMEKKRWPDEIGKHSYKAQKLAVDRREELLKEGKSFATETVFSHPSKLDLIKNAQAMGFEVRFIFINLRNTQLAIDRVARRVRAGGHDVPEEKIKSRHPKTLDNAKEAISLADYSVVYDNSALNSQHKLVMQLEKGRVVRLKENVPAWARDTFKDVLKAYSLTQLNPAAASFVMARDLVTEKLGKDAKTFVAKKGESYEGDIIGRTDKHVVQKTGAKSAIAHFRTPELIAQRVGSTVRVSYDRQSNITIDRLTKQQEDDLER
jgi:predicted ABC-type ATPase